MSVLARTVVRWCGVLLLAAGVLLIGSGPALAHDVLVGSDPAQGSTIGVVPGRVSFTFDQPVQNFDPVVAITGPDGVSHTATQVSVLGNVVSAPFGETAAGAYIAAYRVISADGHPVTGEVHFTVAAGASAGPAAPSDAPTTTAPAPVRASAALPGWAWAALGVAALAVVAALLLILKRPAREPD